MIKSILLYLLLAGTIAWSQVDVPFVKHHTSQDYGVLKIPEVWSVCEDQNGVVYFGLAHDIFAFDGVNYIGYEIEGGFNITALSSINNTVYYGGKGKIGYLKKTGNGSLKDQEIILEEGYLENNVWRIHSWHDKIVFQAEEVIIVFDPNSNEIQYIKPESSFHISFLMDGELFVRERQKGLVKLIDGEVVLVNDNLLIQEYGLFSAIPFNDNQHLIITADLGLRLLSNDGTGSFEDFCGEDCSYLVGKNIIGGAQLSNGKIALNSLTDGCFIIDEKGNLVQHLSTNNVLLSNDIKSMSIGMNGVLWLATGNGLTKVETSKAITYITERSGISSNVLDVGYFKDHLFIATQTGLLISETNNISLNSTAVSKTVWDIEVKDSLMFVAGDEGLQLTRNGSDFERLLNFNLSACYYDQDQKFVIVGGANGIFILDEFSDWLPFDSYQINTGKVTGIVKDNKNNCYWVGTENIGIIRIKFDGFAFEFTHYKLGEEGRGIKSLSVTKPFYYQNSVVFGTRYDILRFVPEEKIIEEMKESGVWNDTMINYPDLYFRGEFYEEQNLIGQGEDIYYSDFVQNNDLKIAVLDNELGIYDNETRSYDYAPFKSLEIGRINFIKNLGEYLYVGGTNTLARINLTEAINKDYSKLAININLNRIITSGTDTLYSSAMEESDILIPYKSNSVNISFSSNQIHNEFKPQYSYRLIGLSNVWSIPSVSSSVEFNNLSEGEYTLEVKAIDIYGNESEIKSVAFTIETPWYRTWWAITLYILLFLFVVYIAIVLGRKRLKVQNQKLETIVEERTTEIRDKNLELEHSYHEIAEQKQEITDSINYAQRIQQAILPLHEDIASRIEDYFVLFRPKDIVSGDFYWFAHKNEHSIFVCADCTGHGVPGAFMSMIGSDKLNQAVLERGITNPAEILSWVNKGIKKALKQDEDAENASRDGMDVAIVSIDWSNQSLKFAGAHNGLTLIRNNEIIDYKATKVAVAGFTKEDQEYELNEIKIQKDDRFYMTTDGYPDQFGGERGKKLKSKIMKKFILNIHRDSMVNQKIALEKYMDEWMNDEHEQIDDICVIGIRV